MSHKNNHRNHNNNTSDSNKFESEAPSEDLDPTEIDSSEINDENDIHFNPSIEENMENEIIESQEEINDLKDKLARTQAEFLNYKNRTQKETLNLSELLTEGIIERFFPVLDDLDRIEEQGDLKKDPNLEKVNEKIREILKNLKVSSYGSVGEKFDPTIHEAILSNETDKVQEPTINALASKGYKIGDKIIRPAKVVVDNPQKSSSADAQSSIQSEAERENSCEINPDPDSMDDERG